MATAAAAFPTDWQDLVTTALKKAREADPTKAVFGLNLPEAWKPELMYYVRNGEVRRLFGVRAVSFGGKAITVFDEPSAKKEEKTQKKAG